jgi:hypothetical protein
LRHPHYVAGRHRQLEVPIDAALTSIQCLPDPADGLAPAEVFFDALPDRLADGVACLRRLDLALTVVGAMLLSMSPGFRSGQVIR